MKKKNQFSQTEAVKVVDAATQTEEEEEVEEKLRQVENEKSFQTEEEVVVELKSLVNDDLSSQPTDAEVMELKKTLKHVDNKKPNQTVEVVEKTPRQEDDRKLTKTADLRKVDKLCQHGSRYVLLVKEGTEVRKRGEDKEVQGAEVEGREEEKDDQASEEKEGEQGVEGEDREEEEQKEEEKKEMKESGTIYSYAITEGKNMKKGDTTNNKHCTLFH